MNNNKNVLEKWFEFREEELEDLSKVDKKYLYDFEKTTNEILKYVDGEMYQFIKKELDKLEEEVLYSMEHFNRKYYIEGFIDALNVTVEIKNN